MPIILRILLIIAIIIYFVMLLHFLKQKRFFLKYTLLWMFGGVGALILIVFPRLLTEIAILCRIEAPMNALFVIAIFFVALLVLSLTAIVSKQEQKIREMAQQISFLEKRIRDIEGKNNEG